MIPPSELKQIGLEFEQPEASMVANGSLRDEQARARYLVGVGCRTHGDNVARRARCRRLPWRPPRATRRSRGRLHFVADGL